MIDTIEAPVSTKRSPKEEISLAERQTHLLPQEVCAILVEGAESRRPPTRTIAHRLFAEEQGISIEESPRLTQAIELNHTPKPEKHDPIKEATLTALFKSVSLRTSLLHEIVTSRGESPVSLSDLNAMLIAQLAIIRAQESIFSRAGHPQGDTNQEDIAMDKAMSGIRKTIARAPYAPEKVWYPWKDFCAVSPTESLAYTCEMGEAINLQDPDSVATLIYAATLALQEVQPYAQEAGQPIGYLNRPKVGRATMVTVDFKDPRPNSEQSQADSESRLDNPIPHVILRKKAGLWQARTVNVRLSAGLDTFKEEVRDVMETDSGWRPLGYFEGALTVINTDRSDRLFSLDAALQGLNAVHSRRPEMVFYEATETGGEPISHLQAGFNHYAMDGRMANMVLEGGVLIPAKFNEFGEEISPEVKLKGVKGFYKELSGDTIDEINHPVNKGEFRLEHYDKVVVMETGWDQRIGADVLTYAALFAQDILIKRKREVQNKRWKNATAAANNTITDKDNPLIPLSPGTQYYPDPERYQPGNQWFDRRHVIGLINSLDSFKEDRYKIENYDQIRAKMKEKLADPNTPAEEKAYYEHPLPPGLEAMSVITESILPDRLQDHVLWLNRTGIMEGARAGTTFTPVIIVENVTDRQSCSKHPTVAGRDLHNLVIQQRPDRLSLIYSVDPVSKFLPGNEILNVAQFTSRVLVDVASSVEEWKQNKGTLDELNALLEERYQKYTQEVKLIA